MKITKEMLKDWEAGADVYGWYCGAYPDGEGEYQDVLDRLVADGRVDDARWLLEKAGPTDDVLELESVDADHLVYAGAISVKWSIAIKGVLATGRGIKAGNVIYADWGIYAGEGISAGRGIYAGWDISAGGGITAGWSITAGNGISAGLRVPSEQWSTDAVIMAARKPNNIVFGHWVEKESK